MRRPAFVIVIGVLGAALALVACGGSDDTNSGRSDSTSSTTASTEKATTTAGPPSCDPSVQKNVVYATRPDTPASSTSLDVYPAPHACTGAPTPIIVWVHGGGWSAGDKANVGAKLDLFAGMGAAVVSVNYRLSPRPGSATGGPIDAPGRVQHPDHAQDVAAAIAWAVDEAPSFGGDPDRVALVGHSAGGHLVALVGTDVAYLRDAGVPAASLGCVVALDTEGYDLAAKVATGGSSEALVRNAFGNDPQVWHDASPIVHAAEVTDVQFLVITRGSVRRQNEAVRFVDTVNASGGSAQLVRAPGYTHEDVNRRLGEAGESVVSPPVETFLRSCLAIT